VTYAERRSITCVFCGSINENDSEGRDSCWKCGTYLHHEGNALGLDPAEAQARADDFDARLSAQLASFKR
jgi:hypothetical protein